MRIESLGYFIEIAEYGSFNKAAESLYISQPSLSRMIHNLEQELGMTLFGRSNHGIQLTEDGKKVYYYGKHVLKQIQSLEDYFTFTQLELPTKLSISVCGIFLSGLLLNEYYEKNQTDRMELLLNEVHLEQVLINVATLVSDLGIVTVFDHQFTHFKRVLDIKELEYEEIGSSPIYIHIGLNNPSFDQHSLKLEQLSEYPLICLPDDYFSHLGTLMHTEAIPAGKFKKMMTMNNIHSIISLIANSEAVFIGNRWSGKDLNNDRIHSLPLEEGGQHQRLFAIKRKNDCLSPAARSFREIFLSHYRE